MMEIKKSDDILQEDVTAFNKLILYHIDGGRITWSIT